MTLLPANLSDLVSESAARLVSRADNARGLLAGDIAERVTKAVQKYLLSAEPDADRNAIREFIDEMRADDLCLIIACERGNEKAWEDLVANFDATVKSAARKMTSNAEDAEDLAGSIWAELYGLRQDAEGNKKSKLAYYSGRGSLAGWLRAVVSQLAVDEHRKQSRMVQIEEDREFENLAAESSISNNGMVTHAETPEDLLTRDETAADIFEALRDAFVGLEAEDRLILKLYYFNGLKLKDMAATFGYHEATASRRLSRIQADIRKKVERSLRDEHGWTDSEVKRHLAAAAQKLGMSLEKMLAALMFMAILQEMWSVSVL